MQFVLSALLATTNKSEVFQKSIAPHVLMASKTPIFSRAAISALAPHDRGRLVLGNCLNLANYMEAGHKLCIKGAKLYPGLLIIKPRACCLIRTGIGEVKNLKKFVLNHT